MVLLVEALHTLSDIFISAFLLVALIWSRRKTDAIHMFGYGRAQNVAAFVAATLFISFTSYKLFEESIPRLFRAEPSQYSHLWLALTVILISMVIAVVPLVALLRQNSGAPLRGHSSWNWLTINWDCLRRSWARCSFSGVGRLVIRSRPWW